MKKLYLLLLLFFMLFLHAQKEVLMANDWQLNKTIISGTEYPYTIPAGSDYKGVAKFYEDIIFTGFCFSTDFVINYISNNTFTLGSGGGVLDCYTSYDQYFHAIFGSAIGIRSFTYSIQNQDNRKWLTITNADGNKAIYVSKENMNVGDVSAQKLGLHPNPVKDKLVININEIIEKVEILSLSGQVIKISSSKEIDTSSLLKGNYIVKIKTNKGAVTEKLIKD